jgi:hypothetical protein
MPDFSVKKSALLVLVLSVIFLLCWEYYWRSSGYVLGYNDDDALWCKYRSMVYQPNSTVFIGSSRMKFDLDIPTWEATTGEKAVQLSIAGSNPRSALVNLGEDEKFKGKLVVDVTEGLFFGTWPDAQLTSHLKYLKEATPSQKVSAQLGFALEHGLLFLDKELFSLNALLTRLYLHDRKGVRGDVPWPTKFTTTNFRRQEIMTQEFVKDTTLQRRVTDIWTMFGALDKYHGVTRDTLQKIFDEVKTAVTKIKARGGQVIFTRTPSSGGYWANEPLQHPRKEYYDQLPAITQCGSIHFKDYPDTKDFICPEWSHLKPTDAVLYTQALIGHLKEQHWFSDAD